MNFLESADPSTVWLREPVMRDAGREIVSDPDGVTLELASSDASRMLTKQIKLYCKGYILGRSFLIAGHRGAGKTTMVLKAVEDAGDQLVEQDKRPGAQAWVAMPMLVRLYGPDLLPQGKSDNKLREVTLREATKGIYRSGVDAVFRAYRARVLDAAANIQEPLQRERSRELFELAGQLRVRMDEAADLATLREFWRRADLLGGGALFNRLRKSDRDQAVLELVALSSAAQAYRRVIGTFSKSEKDEKTSGAERGLEFKAGFDLKNLINPLTALLVAAIAGVGLQSVATVPVSAAAGAGAGLAVSYGLSYSSSRKRTAKRTSEINFLPDTTVASLNGALPVLVELFRKAGLAPVFVVDELDKVENLRERMSQMISHLKQFVTDRSFFCFLTDRAYIDSLLSLSKKGDYPKEHSFFTDRMFVVHTPADLQTYLTKVMQPENSDDTLDRDVLPYYLLHRSRMHFLDLKRELHRMRGKEAPRPGAVRTYAAYQYDVLIQVAIEWVLNSDVVKERLRKDPDFRQVTYDTLYYPSRMWEEPDRALDVSHDGLRDHLKTFFGATLGDNDLDFLHGSLLQLVEYLVEPSRLLQAINQSAPDFISEAVKSALPTNPLLRTIP